MKTPRNKNVKCVIVDEETIFRHVVWRHSDLPKEEIDKMWEEKNTRGYWASVVLAHKEENKIVGIQKRRAKALAKKVLKMAKEIKEAQKFLLDISYNDQSHGGFIPCYELDEFRNDKTMSLALQVNVELPYMEDED